MARFLFYWRRNSIAPWPTDPSEVMKLSEWIYTTLDDFIEKGEIEDFGYFPDGQSGYGISKGETLDIFKLTRMFQPYVLFKVHEIIPYEKAKEINLAITKAKMEVAANH